MRRRGGKAIVEAVGIPEEGKEVGYEGGYRAIGSSQSLDHFIGCQSLMCHFQRAHSNRPATAKHDSGGLGIEVDVELGGRGSITKADCSTQERNGLDLGDDGRLAAYGGSDIGKRAGRHKRDVAVRPEQRFNEQVYGVEFHGFDIRFGYARPIQARFPVDVGRVLCWAQQRAIHATGNGYVAEICQRADLQRVVRGLIKRLIARDGGYSYQVNLGMTARQQDGNGVVMAGVAIEDNFVFHGAAYLKAWNSVSTCRICFTISAAS